MHNLLNFKPTQGELRAERKYFDNLAKNNLTILEEIHGKFSEVLGEFGEVAIAGGCVRDLLMGKIPKDYDVFILNTNPNDKVLNSQIKIKLDTLALPNIPSEVDWHKSEPFLIATVNAGVLFKGHDLEGTKEAQILLSPYKNIKKLVSSFDWNVCLFGWSEEGLYKEEEVENIGKGKELKLNRITFPQSTLRRGYRFSERFLMKLRNSDLAKLTYLVHCNLNKHNYEI